MSEVEGNQFVFTWHIKNFSMCPVGVGDSISSPVFEVNAIRNSEWFLKLYPKSETKDGNLTCYLKLDKFGDTRGSIGISASLSVYPLTGSELIKAEFTWENRLNNTLCNSEMATITEIFENKDEYLPNDTLTIECVIESKNYSIENEIFEALARDKMKKENVLNKNKCDAITVIELHRKNVIWPIQRIEYLEEYKKITFPLFSNLKDIPSFFVTFFKVEEDEQSGIIQIRTNEKDYHKRQRVRCNISAVNTPPGMTLDASEHEFLFAHGSAWNYPSPINLSKLYRNKYLEYNNGDLYLQLDFVFSVTGHFHHLEKYYWDPIHMPIKNRFFLEEFGALLSDGENSLVSLRAGDRTYKIHRRILSEKSMVFKAMLANESEEKEIKVVDISDVDPDTLALMLAFLYTNNTEDNLSVFDAVRLYDAAIKYQLRPLAAYCSYILALKLTVFNVCKILELADLHQDKQLLKAIDDFIYTNSDSILVSTEWRDLMNNNSLLAAKIMFKLLTAFKV